MFHPRPLHGVSSPCSPLPVRPSPERSPPKLCENGRAYITDPSTGQNLCLCQLETHPAHSLQAHPALRGVGGRALSAPRPRFGDLHSFHAAQLSAMAPLGEQTNSLLPPHIAFHPYGAMYAGMEGPGSPLRRAATRETTGPLKAWLSEHKKNPYPTKAEKIMLAIITRMTLTQVSTWFANARRRLKKDNRLGSGDADDDNDHHNDDTGSMVDMDSDREGDNSDTVSEATSMCLISPATHSAAFALRGAEESLVESRREAERREERRLERVEDVDVEGDGITHKEEQAPLLVNGKVCSSEGDIEPDSFSDISDEEHESYRSRSPRKSRDPHRSPASTSGSGNRLPVITSSPSSSSLLAGSALSDSETPAAGVDLSTSSSSSGCGTGEVTPATEKQKSEQPKPKPKIWSISSILDS